MKYKLEEQEHCEVSPLLGRRRLATFAVGVISLTALYAPRTFTQSIESGFKSTGSRTLLQAANSIEASDFDFLKV